MASFDQQSAPVPVYRGEMSAETLAQYFTDLKRAELLSLATRGGAARTADAPALATVDDARRALHEGMAVQLRYRWEDAEWWDTLTPGGVGARLVRIRHPL